MNSLKPATRIQLTPNQENLLSRISGSLRRQDLEATKNNWRQLVNSLGKSKARVGEDEINDLVWQTIWKAGLGKGIAKATSPTSLESEVKGWEEKPNTIGDDAQLANVDMQNMLQKQQQTLQMISNISKMLHDTAMSVIRKIGG